MIMRMGLRENGDADDEPALDCDDNATGDDEQGGVWMTTARL